MAEGGEDKEQKTEQPTQKRIEEAMKRGQIPFSREVGSFLMLFVLALSVAWLLPGIGGRARDALYPFISQAGDFPTDTAAIGLVLKKLAFTFLGLIIIPLLFALAAAMAASIGQNGFLFSPEPLIPKLEKISPKRGLERMFSLRSLVEFLKGIFKICVVGLVAYLSVADQLGHIRQLPGDDMLALLLFLSHIAVRLLLWVCVAMFFIALFDLIYQRFSYTKSLRMSRQEVKDEYRQQEGDPHVKRRLKRIRMERARKRMMSAVPGADVVITNPTHFAVALKYEGDTMQAPVVVAKGADNMALQLRKIAKEHDVTIVENPPLARALYDAVDIDQEIPLVHYQAVAEIIRYVWQVKGKLPQKRARI